MTSTLTPDVNATDRLISLQRLDECRLLVPSSNFSLQGHDSESASISVEQEPQQLETIVDVYLLMVFFVVSVPLNIVNVIVFWKHGIKERINLCLCFLSIADAMVISVYFALKLDRIYSAVSNGTVFLAKYSISNWLQWLVGFIYVSGFMSTLIAFERCLCVVTPLRAQRILRTETTAAIIVIGHAVILGGYYVIATRWQVVCIFDPANDRMFDAYFASEFYSQNKELVDTFEGLVYGILLPGFYIIGVSLATVVTVVKLRQMKEWRQQSLSPMSAGRHSAKDVTLTRMLIGSSVQFVVCTTPTFLFHSLHPFIPGLDHVGEHNDLFQIFAAIQQLCYYINSSVNFFIYCVFGSKFRTTIKLLFCRSERFLKAR
ncbi:uncharacterized protein LOC143302015 [Babylonia areolata]|uniref:uncharacterized protein LOC143302015 n=1 Tax=Babylonia areolata TaxID=304850 RepID=UPI003FD05FD0